MRTRMLLIFALINIIISCTKENIVEELLNNEHSFNKLNTILSRNAVSQDEYLHTLQTDQLSILINRIEYKDSTYVLTLTPENVKTLNIADSIYKKAIEITKLLNHNNSK